MLLRFLCRRDNQEEAVCFWSGVLSSLVVLCVIPPTPSWCEGRRGGGWHGGGLSMKFSPLSPLQSFVSPVTDEVTEVAGYQDLDLIKELFTETFIVLQHAWESAAVLRGGAGEGRGSSGLILSRPALPVCLTFPSLCFVAP